MRRDEEQVIVLHSSGDREGLSPAMKPDRLRASLSGGRVMRIPAILAPAEIAEAEPFILEALAVFDGKGADAASAKDIEDKRRDRALYWTQGLSWLACNKWHNDEQLRGRTFHNLHWKYPHAC